MYIRVLWLTVLLSIILGLLFAFALPAQLVLIIQLLVLISASCFMFKK